jgi:signal transduction histidine kinase
MDPPAPVDAAPAASLASGVLRLAAGLPSTGPRRGDLTPVAALIGVSVGATSVVVGVFGDPEGDPEPREHGWPAPARQAEQDVGGTTTTRPVRRHGADVGRLVVNLPPVGARAPEPGYSAGADLDRSLDDVAAVLGVVVAIAAAHARLDAARRRGLDIVERIADERERAASQMERERHELERDLHDGAQLHLVSLQLVAGLLEDRLEAGAIEAGALREAMVDIGARLDRTHQLLMETAAGITPMPLRTAGLAPALAQSIRGLDNVTLQIEADVRSRRYPPAVENAVYFTCLEAVNNAQKHAPGAAVTITMRNTYQGLRFTVADSGPGLDDAAAGAGLRALRERLGSAGGSLNVTSVPGTGTEIVGDVPI